MWVRAKSCERSNDDAFDMRLPLLNPSAHTLVVNLYNIQLLAIIWVLSLLFTAHPPLKRVYFPWSNFVDLKQFLRSSAWLLFRWNNLNIMLAGKKTLKLSNKLQRTRHKKFLSNIVLMRAFVSEMINFAKATFLIPHSHHVFPFMNN